MDYRKISTIKPRKRSGKACIGGTRMTATDVLEYLAGGMTQEELLAEFPDLNANDIRACLAYAADHEHRLAALPECSFFSIKTYRRAEIVRSNMQWTFKHCHLDFKQ